MAETVQLPGDSTLTLAFDDLAEYFKTWYRQKFYEAAEMVKLRVQENISEPSPPPSSEGDYPHADTGMLRNSIFAAVDEEAISFEVGTPLLYGLYLEYGTAGGQTVEARPGSVLSWVDPRTGERHYAKWVRLGPIRGRSFLRRTLAEMQQELARLLTQPIPEASLVEGATAAETAAAPVAALAA